MSRLREVPSSHSIYWITERIALGRYLTPERATYLRGEGVTHVLNVGDNPSIVRAADYGFDEIVDCPITDLEPIPIDVATQCASLLHSFSEASTSSKSYVHCLAGQRRSPTIVWLYFVARGIDPALAKSIITKQAFDAVPGHSSLVDEALIQHMVEFGRNCLSLFDKDEIAGMS